MQITNIVLIGLAILGVLGIGFLVYRILRDPHDREPPVKSMTSRDLGMEDVPYEQESFEELAPYPPTSDEHEGFLVDNAAQYPREEGFLVDNAAPLEHFTDLPDPEDEQDVAFEGFADLADTAAPYEPFTLMETAALTDDSNASFPDTGLM